MDQFRLRAVLVAILIALAASLVVVSPALDAVRGFYVDILTALRWRVFGNAHPAGASPAVVVALDEETFNTPPFEGTPSVTWTREIAQVLNALIDGGAKVVGFDIVFPTSIEQSAMRFGDETLGARVRGFDREYLRALSIGARAGKVVLGQVQHQARPILPSQGQRAAVGFGRNIRALNAHTDPDDVIRRVPLSLLVDGEPTPSMSVEIAARTTGNASPLKISSSGVIPNTIALNFAGGADDIPTYSFSDLRACAESGNKDFFRRHFDGKAVLVGTVLDIEDRKITSKRFATAPEGAYAERCVLPPPASGHKFTRDSIAGVYIHATAVNNIVRGDTLVEFSSALTAALSFVMAALAALVALALGPATATVGFLGLALTWVAGATVAFRQAYALPLIEPVLAGLGALGAMIGYRFVIADRGKRLLRQSFSLYLPPALIEKMMTSNKPPALGGEIRNVTVYFSDIEDFSSLSERTDPADLVRAMNEYLSAMTDIVERHGGFVDKYIGDAIVAVFGAPLDDPDHATNAVHAALECAAQLGRLGLIRVVFGSTVRQRIGLNSGEAIVGNIGSRRRFNYTVMGDTVNLASRLEGANKVFGTTVIASETTANATGRAFAWRELDLIRVKGRSQAVRIFEPLAATGQVSPEQALYSDAYADGLARYRTKDFAGAADRFAVAAGADRASAQFLERASKLASAPPGPDWDAVNTLEEK